MARISLILVVCLALVGLSACNFLGELREELKERVGEKFGDKVEKYVEKVGKKIEHMKERFLRHWDKWEYEGKHGFKHWVKHARACGDEAQSPINLPHYHEHEKDEDLGDIDIKDDFADDDTCEMENDGRTAKAVCKDHSKVIKLSGGGLPDEFAVSEFDFHWGDDDRKGSEHTVNGEQYPMEMQVVAYNTKYEDAEEAKKHDDGVAVMGVLFKVARQAESRSSSSNSSSGSSSGSLSALSSLESSSSSNSSSSAESEESSSSEEESNSTPKSSSGLSSALSALSKSKSTESISSSNGSSSVVSSSAETSESVSSESSEFGSSSKSSSSSSASSSGASSASSEEEEEHEREDVEKMNPLVEALKKIHKPGMKFSLPMKVLRSLLPRNLRRFYRYTGSITVPPCNRAIWTVFRSPVHISEEQLERFRDLKTRRFRRMINNFRPLQLLFNRRIHFN